MAQRSDVNFETTLADGTRVLFRPITPADRDRLRAGFERLSPQSRYRRFFSSIDHLSDAQLEYLTEVDGENHCAWIGLLPDQPGSPGVGVGRWVRLADEPEVAEAAVTVLDDYHNRGIGTALLLLVARSAVEQGVKALRAWVLADNAPMLEILESLGAHPGRVHDAVREVSVPLPIDPEELDRTPAPLILRRVASGEIEGRAHPEDLGRVRLD